MLIDRFKFNYNICFLFIISITSKLCPNHFSLLITSIYTPFLLFSILFLFFIFFLYPSYHLLLPVITIFLSLTTIITHLSHSNSSIILIFFLKYSQISYTLIYFIFLSSDQIYYKHIFNIFNLIYSHLIFALKHMNLNTSDSCL